MASAWERLEAIKLRHKVVKSVRRLLRYRPTPERAVEIRASIVETLAVEEKCRRCGNYLNQSGGCTNHECGQ